MHHCALWWPAANGTAASAIDTPAPANGTADSLQEAARHTDANARVEHGAKVLFLETELHNDRARRFYERIGLTAEDSIWMEMRLTEDGTAHSQTDALRKI